MLDRGIVGELSVCLHLLNNTEHAWGKMKLVQNQIANWHCPVLLHTFVILFLLQFVHHIIQGQTRDAYCVIRFTWGQLNRRETNKQTNKEQK